MKLPLLPAKTSLKGKRVFIRVDWNVPLNGSFAAEDSLKVSRSVETVRMLAKRGAVVLVATHLGRPKGHDASLSTHKILHRVSSQHGVKMDFLGEALDTEKGLKAAAANVKTAKPGSIILLENVRFYTGEEKNTPALAKAYASLADMYMNEAFASCHRAHASVVGIAKLLPRYAGPALVQEVTALEKVLVKPKHPFVAVIGGAKLTTKFPVLAALLTVADRVCIGGAMAHAFFVAQKKEIGKSFLEKEGVAYAKKLLKDKKILLPIDVVVAAKVASGVRPHTARVGAVKKSEMIGDIGPETMRAWAQEIRSAKTIVWNGPVGVAEIPAFSHGSLVLAHAIAARSKGSAYGVVGGGDTLPVALATGMSQWIDHLSTGGGAMLEFIAHKGTLPGLTALSAARSKTKKRA